MHEYDNFNMCKPLEIYSGRVAPAASLIYCGPVPRRWQPHDLLDPLPKPTRPIAALVFSPQPRAEGDHHVRVYNVTLAFLCDLGYVFR